MADAQLPLNPFEYGGLFSEHFLRERMPAWPEFDPAGHESLRDDLRALWTAERSSLANANEAQTEERFIRPVLARLGFHWTVQSGLPVAGGRRQPDYALFLTDEERAAADAVTGAARYERAVAVADAKAFDRPLVRRRPGGALSEDPVAQIINYVLVTRRRWGILTNGRLWRLYANEAGLIEGAYWQADLVTLLESEDLGAFAYFATLLSAASFAADPGEASLTQRTLDDSRAHAIAVGVSLERQVFTALPLVAQGLLGTEEPTRANLDAAFDHALVFLYRLLFCLYAEARGLLPTGNPHYLDYSLLSHRRRIATDRDRGRVYSSRSDDLHNDLRALFGIVERGDPDLGVNEYDGGLFSNRAHPYFVDRSIPDSLLAPALDGLYRTGGQFVDYRDLSPRHLGSIYERLLDFQLSADEGGSLTLEASPGRHETGTYYTPDFIVDAIVESTLEPLLMACSRAVAETGLSGRNALEAFLALRVLDPAMGSGHFLVSAASYIAQFIATDPSYQGDPPLLDVRRMVAERCLYGVDLNPMAVELARLSLWLSTVRGDEPLAFLANLRDGNSLVGARVSELLAGDGDLFTERFGRSARELLAGVDEIRQRESRAGADVHEKERLAAIVEELRAPLEGMADGTVEPFFPSGAGRFFHWELEFPEVFLTLDGAWRDDAGFDAVIGNPPYVRIQELGRELAAYCRRTYDTASGSFDVYIPFVERSLGLLARYGRLGFILPNKLFKLDFGRRMRAWLAEREMVDAIVDFGDAQLFEGTTNYTCILILDRAGRPELEYRRVGGSLGAVRRALTGGASVPVERYTTADFDDQPWVLAAGEEARLLRAVADGAERLDAVTRGIFTGLQTSADPVYILEERGRRGSNRVVFSRAAGHELEIEPDLLHPLASGADVGRYAFAPLSDLLLFPYRPGENGRMELVPSGALAGLPLTMEYLRSQEAALRGRERGKMDHDGWYGYVYPKSLDAHDLPKLGIPRLCERLRASADPGGEVYLDNVDVNGILLTPTGPSLWTLLPILNSRLLDYVFRRVSVPFRGAFYSANKQFIAPLPIRLPDSAAVAEVEALGRRLHDAAKARGEERAGFLAWLEGWLGTRLSRLQGATTLRTYEGQTLDDLLAVLRRNRARLSRDPETRAFREELNHELTASVDRLSEFRNSLALDEANAGEMVYELYELTSAHRAAVEAEYGA